MTTRNFAFPRARLFKLVLLFIKKNVLKHKFNDKFLQMSNTMNLIFETGDLDQASPATVSRCGMVFMDPMQLGVTSLIKSFVEGPLVKLLPKQDLQVQLMHKVLLWIVPPTLAATKGLPKFVEMSEMYQFNVRFH